MLHRLILKVTKFQLSPHKRLSTVVKNILGGHRARHPYQVGLREAVWTRPVAPAYGVNGTKRYCANERQSIHKVGKVDHILQEMYNYDGYNYKLGL